MSIGAPEPVSSRSTLIGAAPGPISALLGTSPSAASISSALDDDGFGDNVEPAGSAPSALAQVMSATPSPAITTTASPYGAAAASPFGADANPQATTIPDGPAATTTPDGDAEILDDDDFAFARQPNVVARIVATIRGNRVIAAGAAGLLVITSALTFCGGGSSSKSRQVAASKGSHASSATSQNGAREPEAPTPVEPAAVAPVEPAVGSAAAAVEPAATGPTAEELAAAAEPTSAGTAAPVTQPKRDTTKTTNTKPTPSGGGKKLGGKQVILEYDAQARETKPVASAAQSDQASIQKARRAYASGNQRLFAGDPAGAIKFYREALGFYPGYVAGYRGLGLAYAQQGDKPKALQALRTYVGSVPTAKDAALIRKRISSLSSK